MFDAEFVPKAGLKLLVDDTVFEPISSSAISLEKLNTQKVRHHLETKYLGTFSQEERIRILTSWDRLLDKLERLATRHNFETMKITDLPKSSQIEELLPPLPEALDFLEDRVIPELEVHN